MRREPDSPPRSTTNLGTERRSATTPVAVTTHSLASQAAVDLMQAGGSAVDAMIAANAVVAVTLPDTCGPGGDLFALVHEPGDPAPAVLNASGRAGALVDPAVMRERYGEDMPLRSPETVTVPGCVDGWAALSERYGAVTLAEALAPAIDLAREGFEVSPELAVSLERIRALIGDQPAAAAIYPGGEPPAAGTVLRRPRLADTLEAVATGGREAFYGGEAGAGIVAATGGKVTEDDLARVQAEWVEPLGSRVFGRDAWTVPPSSQGYITLAAASIFERIGPPRDPEDPAFVHAAIEAYRAVAWERDDVLADPDFMDREPATLLDPDELRRRAERISGGSPAQWPPPPWRPGGTAFFCAWDGRGMGVSLIQSNFHGIGSGLSAGDTGVFLHNRGAGFNLRPGHPNELQPGRRPVHTLSPTLWTTDGSLRLLLGTRGGQFQPQLLLQVVSHLYWTGASLRDSQHRPRWEVSGWEKSSQHHRVHLESRHSDRIEDGLLLRGHDVVRAGPWETGWGPVAAIEVNGSLVEGAADPRVSTSAAMAAAV